MGFFLGKKKEVSVEMAPAPEEEYAVMPKELRIAIAQLNGRAPIPVDQVVKVPVSEAFPITYARKQEEALKNPQIGQLIDGKGVFLGIWEPKDRSRKSLGKKFNLY